MNCRVSVTLKRYRFTPLSDAIPVPADEKVGDSSEAGMPSVPDPQGVHTAKDVRAPFFDMHMHMHMHCTYRLSVQWTYHMSSAHHLR
jgi:hypothetical protein